MKWLYDTIAGRTILVLVIGIGSVLALSHTLYEIGLEREARQHDTARLADRLAFLKQTIMRVPPGERDAAAHALSGGPIEIHWSLQPLASPGGMTAEAADRLQQELVERVPEIAELGLVIGASKEDESHASKDESPGHVLLISMQLQDGSWVNLSRVMLAGSRFSSPSFWISALIMMAGALVVSALMASWLTRPLSELTNATHRLFATPVPEPIPPRGPKEVRDLSMAFNEMQVRINQLLTDRTQMLAAISHDLRTPITRLRLRLEENIEEKAKTSASSDLDEMEEMIDAALAFLKGEATDEIIQTLDLVAVLETITGDMTDAGAAVSLSGARHAVMRGRRLSLKRAFTNLIQNAVKYGGGASVAISQEGAAITVSIEDDGPGIPEEEMERVFSPFYRLESSRARETGGHGLGLTVARTAIRAHGGEITIANLQPKGLQVRVIVPKSDTDHAAKT
jgi:two-component system OmpR family sensor kinase